MPYLSQEEINKMYNSDSNNEDFNDDNTSQIKKCPYCGEKINKDAIKCKYCDSDIVDYRKKNKMLFQKSTLKDIKIAIKFLGIFILIIFFIILFTKQPLVALSLILSPLLIWSIWSKIKLSKKNKWIASSVIIALTFILWIFIGYQNRVPVITIIEPANATPIQSPTISIKGTVNPKKSKIVIQGQNVNMDNGNFIYQANLPDEQNIITITANNQNSKSEKIISVTRIFSPEEVAEKERLIREETARIEREQKENEQKLENKLTNIPKKDNFKIFDSGIGNKVTFDWDEFDYYHYHEAMKDEYILFVKANTSWPIKLYAWTFTKDGNVQHFELDKEFHFRKYADYLRGQPGNDNDFNYRDWVKFVYWTKIPAYLGDEIFYISDNYPNNVLDILNVNMYSQVLK